MGGNDGALADTQDGALVAATNGIVNHGTGNGQIDGFDTWQSDDTGVTTDFVGLGYDIPATFDIVTVELGNQFVDGGDWEVAPNIYILKNPVMNSDSVRPEISPNWVEVSGTETNGHEFDSLVLPGPGEELTFQLTGTADQRTGWGWAVGGVDGNQADSGQYNFISVTELAATGAVVMEISLTGDFNNNGQLDAGDLDLLADAQLADDLAFDLNSDGATDMADRVYWLHELKKTWVGDANLDGEFNSSDLVEVLSAGTYEVDAESGWASGDFDGNRRTNSGDLVAALSDGGYEQGPVEAVRAVPEPAAITMFVSALLIALATVARAKPVARFA